MMVPRVPVGDLAEFINGVAFKPDDWEETGRRIIRIQNLTDLTKPYNRTNRIVAQKYQVLPGDLLVSWSATLGVFVWKGPDTALVNQHIFRVVPKPGLVDAGFLKHMLENALVEMEKHLHGATMKHVNRNEFLSTTIPLPPLAEQKRIAAILDAADALRAKRRETLAQLDTLLQSTFLDMFGDPVTNPKGWRVSTLGQECVEIKNGRSIKQSQNAGGIPISRIETISDGVVNPDKVGYAGLELGDAEKDILRPGDILFSHINSTKHLCKCAIYQKDHGILVHGMNLLRFRTGKDLNPLFLLYLLKNEKYRITLMRHENPAVNQSSIASGKLKTHMMLVPPLPLQRRFATIVESVEQQKTRLRAHLAELDTLFASLQDGAFKGAL